MAIHIKSGNLLTSKCDILVNTVNCVGVMGTGIALDFKNKYSKMFKAYKLDCSKNLYTPGCIREYSASDYRIILNLATKNDWKDPSKIEWIKYGLNELRNYLEGTSYTLALPAIGCNNGKLNWEQVRILIYNALNNLDNYIELYLPLV